MVDRVDDYLCTHLGLKDVLVSQVLPKKARTTHGRLLLHSPHKDHDGNAMLRDGTRWPRGNCLRQTRTVNGRRALTQGNSRA